MNKRKQKIGKSAIYKIVNNINNKLYIGSCVGHYLRKGQHWYRLRKGTHDNNHLQNSWNKYGEENFEFIVIEFVPDVNNLIKREQHWIDTLKVCDRTIGYNKAPRAGSNLGRKMSKEARRKMSLAKKGIKQDPEVVKRRILAASVAVDQYTKEGEFVASFVSVKSAAESLGILPSSISKVLSDTFPQCKSAGGYIWKYGSS